MIQDIKYSFYLASSWLWCIGAFVPVILITDFSAGTLLPFLVLNILGASWFGFYFSQNRVKQKQFVERHRSALKSFSYVTMAYQLFFVTWISAELNQPWLIAVVFVLIMTFLYLRNWIANIAVLLFLVSLGLLINYLSNSLAPFPDLSLDLNSLNIALPLALGFLLTPYLDLTFHRAFTQSKNPRSVFAIGFGMLFLTLIVFSISYAQEVAMWFASGTFTVSLYPVIAFMLLQLAFTTAVHAQESERHKGIALPKQILMILAFVIVAGSVMFNLPEPLIPWINLSLGEVIYKSFLFMYGLVFPLWLILNQHKTFFLVILLMATPAYALVFFYDASLLYTLYISMFLVAYSIWFAKQNPIEQRLLQTQ